MSSSREPALRAMRTAGPGRALALALALAGVMAAAAAAAQPSQFAGIGRAATPKEIAAWDIDVRPDFRGLPKGAGTVAKGMDVWEAKCASCHGVFGESNEVFAPIVGGTSKEDIKTGRARRLTDEGFPGRTTMMKLSTVSTLWDYINRAMPWNAPKSLSVEEVYAVTAYLLHLGDVLPENFTLSHENIAQVQAMLPNRNGKTTDHGLWPGRSMGNGGKPDVKTVACMDNCATEAKVASLLPDFARNAHGNLAEQNRLVGPQHGADTTRPAGATTVARAAPAAPAAAPAAATASGLKLAQTNNCMVCHGVDNKIVGPGMVEVAKKYQGRADALAYLTQKIKAGGSGVWGAIPMPAQTLSDADAKAIAQWLTEGARR